jgi:SEL1 protein
MFLLTKLIFEVPKKQWSLSEWISNFLKDDGSYYPDSDLDSDYLPETDPMPGGDADGLYEDILDDGLLETLLMIGLAGALVFLIWYRQQQQLAHRQQNEAANGQNAAGFNGQQQQEDRGLFPQPGDPEFNQWVAGGVGH